MIMTNKFNIGDIVQVKSLEKMKEFGFCMNSEHEFYNYPNTIGQITSVYKLEREYAYKIKPIYTRSSSTNYTGTIWLENILEIYDENNNLEISDNELNNLLGMNHV